MTEGSGSDGIRGSSEQAGPVDGTSLVNAEGEILVFVADTDWSDFEEFVQKGSRVALVDAAGEAHVRTYGSLTAETLRRRGSLIAIEISAGGRRGRGAVLGTRRGR